MPNLLLLSRTVLLAAAVVTLAAGCTGDRAQEAQPPTAPASDQTEALEVRHNDWVPGQDADGAAITGRLAVRDGCVVLLDQAGEAASEVAWPKGWTARVGGGGRGVEVLRADGSTAVPAGNELNASGGASAGTGCNGLPILNVTDDLR